MAYNSHGKRITSENLAGQITTTAWDCCFAYGYNEKSELTNAVAAVDSDYRYAYDFDEIGNRETSSERGTNSVYAANNLNQYTSISNSAASALSAGEFVPQFDDDMRPRQRRRVARRSEATEPRSGRKRPRNQTLIKTATGIWQVQYNGENRPILWECVSTNSTTPNSTAPSLISMSYDRMGRRVAKNNQRFVYDGYLQVANFEHSETNSQLTTYNFQLFIWDPTEKVATRPLAWLVLRSLGEGGYYTHDGNKNVSEVVEGNGILAAHYEYAPFGMFAVQKGIYASRNPWCFSSEYLDCEIMMLYYNFRYNNLLNNFWSSRDITGEKFDNNLYRYVDNQPIYAIDVLGNHKLSGPTVSEVKWVQRESDPRAFILEVKAKGIEPGCELNFIQLFKRNDGVDFPNWRVDNISTSGGPNPEDMYYYDTFDYRQKRFYHKDGTVEFYDKPGTDDLEFFLFIVQRCCLEYYGGKKECHCCKRSRATILGRLHWKTLSTPSQNNLYVALSEKLSSQEKQFADFLLKKLLKNGGVQNDCKKYRKDHPNDPVLVTSIELQFN